MASRSQKRAFAEDVTLLGDDVPLMEEDGSDQEASQGQSRLGSGLERPSFCIFSCHRLRIVSRVPFMATREYHAGDWHAGVF